jgi:hypothetical protein
VKLLTYIIGTPDEIANLFENTAARKLWDPMVTDCQKVSEGTFNIRYGQMSETKQYFSAMTSGTFHIVEKVNNGEQQNIYCF